MIRQFPEANLLLTKQLLTGQFNYRIYIITHYLSINGQLVVYYVAKLICHERAGNKWPTSG